MQAVDEGEHIRRPDASNHGQSFSISHEVGGEDSIEIIFLSNDTEFTHFISLD